MSAFRDTTHPKAKKVTPAVLSPIPSLSATVARFGQKKSEAVMPIVAKRKIALFPTSATRIQLLATNKRQIPQKQKRQV